MLPLTYTYDLLGDITSSTDGEGVTLTNSYNAGARLTSVKSSLSDSNHPGTPFGYQNPAHYNAAGSLTSVTLGNNVSASRTYDNRLRLTGINDGSVYTLAIPTNGYAPNSDILAANDSVNNSWVYTYDPFNRLVTSSVNNGATTYGYAYDRFGNRWQQNVTHGTGTPSSLGFDATNRITASYGVSYDASGDTSSDGTTTYTYDAEGRIATANNGTSGTSTYVYDAEGRRIRKTTVAGGTVDFLYDLAGHEVLQLSSTGTWTRGEVYAGGRHVATYSGGTGGTTYFIHSDWLGTERARSTVTGTPYETCTSLPFGDALTCTGTDVSPMHFTGKERDSESGLDNFEARYDSSQFGRFMSPDPIFFQVSMLADPQQWNEYAYVRNNPLSLVDPTGEAIELTCQDTDPDKCEGERQKELQALKDAVGKQAGAYLYENKVTTTDANGNSTTNYYVGVYTNGPNGNGPAFQDINAASNAIGGIISDSRVAELNVVPGGTTITSSSASTAVIDAIGRGTPGATYIGQDGKLHVTLLDTSATAPGVFPPDYMSNNQPGTVNEGILGGHEFGHVQYQWSNWFSQLFGNSNSSAVRLENDVRRLQDPSAATRTKH